MSKKLDFELLASKGFDSEALLDALAQITYVEKCIRHFSMDDELSYLYSSLVNVKNNLSNFIASLTSNNIDTFKKRSLINSDSDIPPIFKMCNRKFMSEMVLLMLDESFEVIKYYYYIINVLV